MTEFAHIGFAVKDLNKSKDFYVAALAPLGLVLQSEGESSIHIGKPDDNTMLWIHNRALAATPVHISFEVQTKEEVQKFFDAALAAGGKDNGAPGIRADYSTNYYAAFIIDPDGHNVEVICRN